MSKSPAFQFYPDDFMGGKPGMMTPEQTHVYVWLLCLDWNQGGFPLDIPTLARWCRVTPAIFRRAWSVVQECFSSKEGRWFNERLEKERQKQAEWREKSAKGGKSKRKPKENHPFDLVGENDEPKANTPVSSLQSPTPVTATTSTPPPAGEVGLTDRLESQQQCEAIAAFLTAVPDIPGRSRKAVETAWVARLTAWLDGLDFPTGAVSPSVLATALREYVDAPDATSYNPAHVKDFVIRTLRQTKRLVPEKSTRPANAADRVSATIAQMTGRTA